MKITNPKNFKGAPLEEWELEEEHDEYFLLGKASGEKLNLPKSTFENQKENFGASRNGSVFLIPKAPIKT
jgi:hypothetical protein